jgi:hypothetical protein
MPLVRRGEHRTLPSPMGQARKMNGLPRPPDWIYKYIQHK